MEQLETRVLKLIREKGRVKLMVVFREFRDELPSRRHVRRVLDYLESCGQVMVVNTKMVYMATENVGKVYPAEKPAKARKRLPFSAVPRPPKPSRKNPPKDGWEFLAPAGERANKLNYYGPAVGENVPEVPKRRTCLRCGDTFISWGVGNRLCKPCAAAAN